MIMPSRSMRPPLTISALLIAVGVGCGAGGVGESGSGFGGADAGSSSSSLSGAGQGGAGGDVFSGNGGGFVGSGPATGSGAGVGGANTCDPKLVGVVRDFKAYTLGGHPDFEHFEGSGLKGIVKPDLGPDQKPVYASAGATAHTTGPFEFDQWYRDVPDVNKSIPFTIALTADPNGIGTFDSEAFFPIDNQGWDNEGFDHNYGFTYELHMVFQYSGGEIFSFTGDDDLWVFVNKRLAIDLGGLHPAQSDTLDLNAKAAELGIEVGKEYSLDLFQAERHSTGSHFKVQSSLNFTNCEPIIIPN